MNKLILIILICLITTLMSAQEMTEAIWLTGEENTKIETYQKGGLWYGKIVSSDNPKAKIGNDILREFKLVDGVWTGKLYAAKRERMMDAMIGPKTDELDITVSAGLFKKQLSWKREMN